MTFSPFRHLDSVLWKRAPIHLTFFVTRRCNARCPFCFYQQEHAPARDEPRDELTVEEVEKVASSLGRLLWLAFSGGEIFLRRDLADLAGAFYRRNRPAIILLPTNGLLTEAVVRQTRAILDGCPESTVVVKLSIDGTRQVHDSLREVPGAFDKVMATYRELKNLLPRYRNLELGVNTLFCTANQKNLDEVIDLVGALDGIRTHTVSMIRGRVPDPALKKVDLDEYLKILGRLESLPSGRYLFRGGRLKAAQDILQRRLIYETHRKGERLIPCYAGNLSLVLDEKGDLFPCEIRSSRMGNVRESGYDIQAILKSDGALRVRRSILAGECHCTHECNFMMNIFFNPRLYPALLKEYARLSLP